MQEGMLFHYLNNNDKQYFIQLSLKFHGRLDTNVMKEALDYVVAKNEMLRTVYRWKGLNNAIQIILKSHKMLLIERKYPNDTSCSEEDYMDLVKLEDLNQQIDIETDPIRVTVIFFCFLYISIM